MSYKTSWDRPHIVGDGKLWQESDCYWFYDAMEGVGGFHRVGQHPHLGTGQIMCFAFAKGGERFSINDSFVIDHPIIPTDRWSEGMRVLNHTAESLGERRMRYTWQEPDCSADLEFYESFHEPIDWPGHTNELMSEMNPGGHLECSGRIRGSLRIGARTYQIDALAHRDRSWGYRDLSMYDWRRYRMASGTVGPALSFASFALDKTNTGRSMGGMVIRYGVIQEVIGVRIITTLDADGYTTLAALPTLTLKGGEVLKIPCKGLQSFCTPMPAAKSFNTDTICEIEWQGERGFCDIEMSPYPGGTFRPPVADGSLMSVSTGLSRATDYTAWAEDVTSSL